MLKRVIITIAALAIAAPAMAGDPVPGLQVALELNAAGPERQPIVAITVERTPIRGGDAVAVQLSENIAEVLARSQVRASGSETVAVARRVISVARGEASPERLQECFSAWCANISVQGQQQAETSPVRR